jgi:CubicO group peptidase (beta-lactamase class C family)
MTKFALVLCLVAAPCFAQEAARFDEVVKPYVDRHAFMGSVLVARGSDIVFSKGYGSADLEWNIPNSATTKFRIGSLTKQFTAASILLLEERGKLKIEDPISTYLPDVPASWRAITIFHLLTHTSGIPNYTAVSAFRSMSRDETPPDKILALVRDAPLEFPPGERFNYSNSGYVVLGEIIEKVSGQSYAAFVEQNLLTPAGMKASGYDSNTAILPNRASGYVAAPPGFANAAFVHMSTPFSAGALYSTTEDLWRWEQALFNGKILSSASLGKMTSPFKEGYAFGVFVRHDGGRDEVLHNGSINGFNSVLGYYPATKTTVVVLGNVNGAAPDDIETKLGRVAHGDTLPAPTAHTEISVPPETLASYVGVYELAPAFAITIRLENGQLTAQATGQPKAPIFAESRTLFFLKVVEAQLEFQTSTSGEVTGLVLHQSGRDQPAKRKQP